MTIRADNVTQTPLCHATVTLPDDVADGLVQLGPLGPDGGPCKAIRWLGTGPAVLWYVPATPRRGYTPSEVLVPVPEPATGAIPSDFQAGGEEQLIEATAIQATTTAGRWKVTY